MPATVKLRVWMRYMIQADIPAVLSIEQASYADPWTEKDFRRCLRERNAIGMVSTQYQDVGDVLGIMIYEMHEDRFELLNFAVAPECRRRGVGSQMVSKLIEKLSSHRRTRVTVDLRERNLPAQLFFQAQGFVATKVLREHYGIEDAYRMAYYLSGHTNHEES